MVGYAPGAYLGRVTDLVLKQAGTPIQGSTSRPPEALADGLRQVRFGYRTLAGDGELGPWEATWEDPARLPLQVRVQVVDARGAWPDLVVALPLAGRFAGAAGTAP